MRKRSSQSVNQELQWDTCIAAWKYRGKKVSMAHSSIAIAPLKLNRKSRLPLGTYTRY